jgi:hypothetical protein
LASNWILAAEKFWVKAGFFDSSFQKFRKNIKIYA